MTGRRSTGAAADGGGAGDGPVPGDVVVGVRLSAVVGRGAAGTVWAGTEVASGARVAVKLLDRSAAGREAALLDGVRHPHVLALRRVEHDPPALVMDLAPGGSLAAQVEARGTLEPGEVVTVLAPLADCLAALHAQGVVHGDVTATNVLFVDAGRPVLADLGVAGLAGDGAAWATPGYAAPEVLAGARPGPAADVHGLGAAAWLALTGTPCPPEADRLPLALLAPGCPPALAVAVTAAVDPDPDRRPRPSELAAAARVSCPGLVVRLVPGAALGVRPDEAVTYRVRQAAAAEGPEPGRRRWWHRLDAFGGRAVGAVVRGVGRGRGTGRDVAGPVLSRPDGTVRDRAGTDRTGRWRRAVAVGAAVAAGVVAVAGLLLVGLPAGGPAAGPAAGPVVGPATAPAVSQGPAASPAPVDAAAPAGSSGDGPADLTSTVLALVAARERALRTGEVSALVQVHDPTGTTLREDQELLLDGPVDVAYEVVDVVAVDGRPGAAQVRLRTTAGGSTTTEAVVLELAAGEDGWRVRSVSR